MVQPLMIVDVQKGFLNEFTRHIPSRIAELVALKRFDPLLFTRFINLPNSPYVRLLDWNGCMQPPETDLAPELAALAENGLVFEKPGYTGLPDSLTTYLRDHGIREVALAGIDTDMCVLKCALDVFDLGLTPIILTDCCASTAGLQAHLAGLAILSRNVGPLQLRETGLGHGLLAAPAPGQPSVPSELVKGTEGAA
jgi:nicotinamidase-related amidase